MNTKKAVFSKLFGKKSLSKTELKNVKIDLALVDDIDSEFNYLQQSYSEASYAPELFEDWTNRIQDIENEMSIEVDNFMLNGAARGFEEAAENMRAKIDELEIKANELGIGPGTLISNYEEILMILDNSNFVNDDFRSSYGELLRYTNERFGLADFL
tara:strand:+ start:381 stop:851 length:471 start_codon:yes stop_codon:yes gene_type:complete